MQWIDTTVLKNWASRRDCQAYLPLVIRRLIRATAVDISHINIPAGDSVVYPGWDGILETTVGNEYLPEGLSVWEIGTNQDIKEKAERDYQKRKENPLGVNPKKTTFIFVTPRIWTNKDEWCAEKKNEGFWKSVEAYDAKVLEEWLEQAPAIGAWLAKYLKIYPEGAVALEDFWSEWSSISNPHFTSEVVLAGRDKQAESVRKWLKSSASPIAVQAATREEALAFLGSVINTLTEIEREFFLSKAIVVENLESFRHITRTQRTGLLLVPQFAEIEWTPQATQKGHHVFIPLGPDNKVTSEKIELPRLGREAFIEALKKIGISETDAQKYSKETGRSLTVLRRRLTNIANQPEWAKEDTARDIIPAFLAGSWKERKKEDETIIGQLAGESYENFSKKISTWLHKPDSPILKIGEWWRLVSPMDAWFALAPFLIEADLQAFKSVALKVLGTIDPALELEPQERWAASIYEMEMIYSKALREGIAQTFVLIAVFGDNTGIPVSTTAQTFVDNIVKKLLLDADWKLWHSLSDVLPLIAEASPVSFLDAVESSLSQDDTPIMGMFSETENSIFPSSAHPKLLWALEGLAWDPQLLGRVTLILGKLARLDPKGKLSSRPINSLRNIFLLWFPNTYASLEQRLEAIDTLIERESEIGWDLLVSLIPHYNDRCISNYKTRWRQFSEKTDVEIFTTEYIRGIKEVTSRLLVHVGSDGYRWAEVMENFSALPPEDRNNVIEQLQSITAKISNGRHELWAKLREILSRHRSYPEGNWALPDKDLKRIENAYFLLEPDDSVKRFSWLFDEYWPHLPEGKERRDYEKLQFIIAQRRLETVKIIKNESGLQGLIKFAEHTSKPQLVGIAVFEAGLNIEEEEALFSLLEEKDNKKISFVQSYIFQRASKEGHKWISKIVDKACSEQWQPNKITNLFLGFPQNRFVWNLLRSLNQEVQEAYWRDCALQISRLLVEDKIYAIHQLLHVKRYFSAVDCAALFAEKIPAKLIAQILLRAATEASLDDSQKHDSYSIEKLFEELDKSTEIEDEVIVQLEWFYLPILADVGSTRPPKMLHRELSNNPEFFAEVLKCVYLPSKKEKASEEESFSQEFLKQRAHFAYDLLDSWKTPPGSDISGQINYEELKEWVVSARALCEKSDRREVGDIHIGKVLAYARTEENNIWPPEPVCKIIDKIQSKELDTGFSTGIYNKRGTVTRSLFEGGQQERELAERFRQYANKWAFRYPRTAGLLTKIAEGYENEAKREDKEAERRDLEY